MVLPEDACSKCLSVGEIVGKAGEQAEKVWTIDGMDPAC